MGDRIVFRFIDNYNYSTPQLYSHSGGFDDLKTVNKLLMEGQYNGFSNLMCNVIVKLMGGKPSPLGYYLDNDVKDDEGGFFDARMWTFHATEEGLNGWNGKSHYVKGYWTSSAVPDRTFTPEEVAEMKEEPFGDETTTE